ncbi:hypothetical protein Bca4012_082529 [Brassica carinata]
MDGATSPNDHVISSPTQVSPGLSSFSQNLDNDDEIISGSSSQRPSRVKKTKMKIKLDDQTSTVIKSLEEDSPFGQYFTDLNGTGSNLPYY